MSAGSPGEWLPPRPHPDWYRKAAKRKLAELRAADPGATLARAQLDIARANGFASWRALIDAINTRRTALTAAGPEPLLAAIRADDGREVERLIAQGADLEQRHGDAEHTALSLAVTLGAFSAAAALVAGGARTDLFCAAAMGDLAAVRSFFAADGTVGPEASFTCRTRFLSLTTRSHQHAAARDVVSDAMYAAVRHSRTEVARFLLPRGVNLRSHAFVGATLLHWACYGGARVIVDLLIDGGADPDARDDSLECTPRAFSICAPARLGDLARVSARLRDDPSLATIDTGRGTPLHEAARGGHEEIVRLLLAHGADPHARDRNGRLPRDLADKASETWIEVLL